MNHKQKEILILGEKEKIDEKLISLIKELNKAGLITLGCCQGHIFNNTDFQNAYIEIDMKNSNIYDISIDKRRRLKICWAKCNIDSLR